jgi:glucosamine-6-phosphate deaminase
MERVVEFKRDSLKVKIYETRDLLGQAAAEMAGRRIRELLQRQPNLNLVFASAPSQDETLDYLLRERDIDWSRICAFHMDEYIGLPADRPQAFGQYIRSRFFSRLNLKEVHYIDGNAPDVHQECARYERLLLEHPTHIAFMGIGENGHLAFNDPHMADFNDPQLVKVNERLDDTCRQQQVNDGHFKRLEEVPTRAITLTMPALFRATTVFLLVPGKSKRVIMERVLEGPIGPDCPGTVMRRHADACLYLDRDSASLLDLSMLKSAE